MSIARWVGRRVAAVIRALLVAVLIGLVGQGAWSALVAINLKISPAIPWAVVVMAAVLWTIWQYLGGRWWPRSNSGVRRRLLRANSVRGPVVGWAIATGASSVTALAGFWIVAAQLVRMPGSVLPAMSQYPRVTVVPMVAMGALVSPILEQAGFWGYCQGMLERDFSPSAAIAITAALFAILPHPPSGAPFLFKLMFFFLIGASFGVIAYLCDSILPGLVVHIAGILAFFTIVWPQDATRTMGADAWFWIHVVQAMVFAILAILAFGRLAKLSGGTSRSTLSSSPSAAD
jgi:membrane protease YdiL (CAAX protease family)